jgi:hypothetical protein
MEHFLGDNEGLFDIKKSISEVKDCLFDFKESILEIKV